MKRSSSVLLVFAAVACSRGERPPVNPPPPPPPNPIIVTTEQFRSLAWLEGRWRGTLDDTAPFYERYRFVNDSTIRTYSLDSAGTATDSSSIMLRFGNVLTGSGNARYGVTEIDSASVHFEPIQGARNAFTWRRDGPGWTAVLTWRDPEGTQHERIYQMRRIGR